MTVKWQERKSAHIINKIREENTNSYMATLKKEKIPKRIKPDLFNHRKFKVSRNDTKLLKLLSKQGINTSP